MVGIKLNPTFKRALSYASGGALSYASKGVLSYA